MFRLHTAATAFVLLLALNAPVSAQVTPIPPFTGSVQEGFESHVWGSFLPCLTPRIFGGTADLCTPGASGSHVTIAWTFMCRIDPHSGSQFTGSSQGLYEFAFDTPVTRFGGYFGTNSGSSDVDIRFYDDMHVLMAMDTVSVTLNCTWTWNGWEVTAGPGFSYVQVENLAFGGAFVDMDDLEIDHAPVAPPPTCVLTGPVGIVTGDASLQIDATSASSPMVDLTFEFSTDGGATFAICAPSPSSPLANPATGVATGISSFVWDPVADGVGVLALEAGVIVRATVDDGVSAMTGECLAAPFDVDNSALCSGLCGDCNLNAIGPDILDALQAAQFAAGLSAPSMMQLGCCDVNASSTIEVLDALLIAQTAAGLPVVVMCL